MRFLRVGQVWLDVPMKLDAGMDDRFVAINLFVGDFHAINRRYVMIMFPTPLEL